MAAIEDFKLETDGQGIYLAYSHALMSAVLTDQLPLSTLCVDVVKMAIQEGVITQDDLKGLSAAMTVLMDSMKGESKEQMKTRMFSSSANRLNELKTDLGATPAESQGLKEIAQLQLDNEGQAIVVAFSVLTFAALLKGKTDIAAGTVAMMKMAMGVGLVVPADVEAALDRAKILSDTYYKKTV